jgi:hypothetical protein
MRRERGKGSPAEHQAAQRFLRAVLSPGQEPLPPTPAATWWDWPFAVREPHYLSGASRKLIPPELDPRISAAYDTVARAYPQAAEGVGGVYQIRSDRPDDYLGEYTSPLGWLGVRTQRNQGQPISPREMVEIMKHEFSHARGLDDRVSDPREIDAYDVSDAARILHEDVNLPYEGPPLVTGVQQMKSKPKPLRRR